MEDDFFPSIEDLPGGGDDRDGFEFVVEFREADHEIGDHVERDMVRRQGPVETRRLGAQVRAKNILAVRRGRTAAGTEKPQQQEEAPGGAFPQWGSIVEC